MRSLLPLMVRQGSRKTPIDKGYKDHTASAKIKKEV